MSDAQKATAEEPPLRTIGLLALAAFASSINIRISDPLLPQVSAGFGVTVGTAAAIVTAFTIGYGVLQLAFGPIGDRLGKYRVAGLLSILAGLATASGGLAASLGDLTLARFAAGAGCSAVIPLAFAWIGDAFPFERRQAVLARFLSAQFTGIVLGQAAGGWLGATFGWRSVLVLVGAIHVVAGLAMLVELKLAPAAQPQSAAAAGSIAATIAGIRRMIARPFVRVMLITVFFEAFAMYGAFAYIGADLVHRHQVGLGAAGIVLAVFGAGAMTYSFSARWLLGRLGERGLVVLGGGVLALAYLLLALVPLIAAAVAALILLGLGFYMLHNTLQTNATQMAPEARGLAVSLFALALFMGQSIGVALAAPLVDRAGAAPVFVVAAVMLPLVALWFRARLGMRDA